MNNIQILILAGVIVVILVTLIYYWYQDAKFKKKVEDNFNQKTHDVLNTSQDIILDGEDTSLIKKERPVLVKDIHDDRKLNSGRVVDLTGNVIQESEDLFVEAEKILADDIPEDSVEAFFAKLDQITFDYKEAGISKELDLLIDVVLESPQKIKLLPAIEQYTQKDYSYYILDKNNQWYEYESGKKYTVNAFKLKVPLIDKDGVANKVQMENIYSELYRFVMQHHAHIRCSDYENQIDHIQAQLKLFKDIELVLELYLLTKDAMPFNKLNRLLTDLKLVNHNNKYYFKHNDEIMFVVSDEQGNPLSNVATYSKLSIVSHLHLTKDPMRLLDYLFDFAEGFMLAVESRMLSTNQQVMSQREYDQLVNYVKSYVNSVTKKNITLGSDLIKRIFVK